MKDKQKIKIFAVALLFVSSFFFVFAVFADTQYENYLTTPNDYLPAGNAGAGQILGQTFTAISTHTITQVVFYDYSGTANCQVDIFATVSDEPIGSSLSTSNSLTMVSGTTNTFIFSSPYTVNNGTQYQFQVSCNTTINIGIHNGSGYSGGNIERVGGSAYPIYSAYFDVYGNSGGSPPPPPTPPLASSSLPTFIGLSAFDFIGTSTPVGSSTVWTGSYIVNTTTQALINLFSDRTQTNLFYGFILFFITGGLVIAYFTHKFK